MPHCNEPDSIAHTFLTCKCLSEEDRHALRYSLGGQYDTDKRVKAVQQRIHIDTERERMVTYNKVKNGTDMTNKRVKLKINDTTQWKDGQIISYDRTSTKACIELE